MLATAHRLATVQNADVIFVLGDGRVMEKGDHSSLLRKRGVYYQMVSTGPGLCLLPGALWLTFVPSANHKLLIGSILGFSLVAIILFFLLLWCLILCKAWL